MGIILNNNYCNKEIKKNNLLVNMSNTYITKSIFEG